MHVLFSILIGLSVVSNRHMEYLIGETLCLMK